MVLLLLLLVLVSTTALLSLTLLIFRSSYSSYSSLYKKKLSSWNASLLVDWENYKSRSSLSLLLNDLCNSLYGLTLSSLLYHANLLLLLQPSVEAAILLFPTPYALPSATAATSDNTSAVNVFCLDYYYYFSRWRCCCLASLLWWRWRRWRRLAMSCHHYIHAFDHSANYSLSLGNYYTLLLVFSFIVSFVDFFALFTAFNRSPTCYKLGHGGIERSRRSCTSDLLSRTRMWRCQRSIMCRYASNRRSSSYKSYELTELSTLCAS